MTVRIVRLGTKRIRGEGVRIGTVRHPPRGVPKSEHASQDWYDVRFPNLAPRAETVTLALKATTDREWAAFVRKYRAEMAAPDVSKTLDLLAALSHHVNFSVGCYCADESHCHRWILRLLLPGRQVRRPHDDHGSDDREMRSDHDAEEDRAGGAGETTDAQHDSLVERLEGALGDA